MMMFVSSVYTAYGTRGGKARSASSRPPSICAITSSASCVQAWRAASQSASRSAGVISGQTFLSGSFRFTCSIRHSLGYTVLLHYSTDRVQANSIGPRASGSRLRVVTVTVEGHGVWPDLCSVLLARQRRHAGRIDVWGSVANYRKQES